ncbi:MAG: AlkA N-terminal domain-containing protein [Myxococcales bacterium]
MPLDPDVCYRAAKSRDARFDGRFFTGVLTTGIYCRPVCPARTPRRENVRFFACAAAAEEAGLRACRRCRPETAPGTPPWLGTSATVSRALRLIDDGALERLGLEGLAARLGLGGRHLRRLFEDQLGASPLAVDISRRLRLARTLLDASALSITDVALASGFGSVRQFNDAVKRAFGAPPRELRRARRKPLDDGPTGLSLRLSYRPPLDWPSLLDFLARRVIPGVEQVEGSTYRRTFRSSAGPAALEVRPAASGHALTLTVPREAGRDLQRLVRQARRLFDLDADPQAIAAVLGESPRLARSLSIRPGLRIPGGWDPFETFVRALLGQQISVSAATTLSGRLVARFGEASGLARGPDRLFPLPERLAEADLSSIGLPGARAASLRAVAHAAVDDPRLFEPGSSLDELVVRLVALPGVGPWTAHYLAMRVYGEPDAFPSGDLGLRRAAGGVSARRLDALAERWRPWRAYAAMHLWAQAGVAHGRRSGQ